MLFTIIGGDRKEYGPVDASQVRQWILEGRADRQTMVRKEGEEAWQPLGSMPEYADLFAPEVEVSHTSIAGRMDPGIGAGNGSPDIRESFREGFRLFNRQAPLMLGGVIVLGAFFIAISLLARMSTVGPILEMGGMVVTGPMLGGYLLLILRALRGEEPQFNTLFEGFREKFGSLALANLVPGVLTTLLCLPAWGLWELAQSLGTTSLVGAALAVTSVILGLAVALVCMVIWVFTLPLVLDRSLALWDAMEVSRKAALTHFGRMVLLQAGMLLLNIAGALACGIGLLVTVPVSLTALMATYEQVFPRVRGGSYFPPQDVLRD